MEENDAFKRRNTCRLCHNQNLQLVLQLAPTPIGDDYISKDQLNKNQDSYPIDLALCSNCGHLQLFDIVNPKIIYKDYIYTSSSSITLEKHFRAYALDVMNRINLPENSLIIDIGSNEGILLKYFKEKNMKVLGIDPAKHIAQIANENGIKTIASFFSPELANKIKNEYGPAKIITANNVFANVDDVDQMVEGIRSLLDPDGIFVLETGYSVDTIQKNIFDNIHHEHLSYFSVKPLKSFFLKHRMEVIDINHVSTKGGSIRVYLQHENGSKNISDSVNNFIKHEENIGIDKPKIFKSLAEKINSERNRLLELLKDLKNTNKIVVGYGAAIGSTQMIYNLDLDKYIDFIVDDNPLRCNLFTPGHHIPVYSSNEIYKKNPDCIIILAWRYAKPIIQKHKKYLEKGGKFLIPFSNPDYEEDFF